MLRRWQHLGGLLPQAAAASSVAAFDWLGPLAAASTGGPRQLSSRARYQQEQQPHAADAWQLLKGRGDGGRGDGGKQLQRGHEATDAPDDRPRTLPAFQSLVSELARRRKAYLIRDVVEEMSLAGVRPDRGLLASALFACMFSRPGDALWLFQEIKRRGMRPNAAEYGMVISACGRAGQLPRMLALKEEMEAAGLPLTHHVRLALLNGFAEAGKMAQAREWFDAIAASGHPADEAAYAGLAACYRHLAQRAVPDGVEAELLQLLADFRAARAELDGTAGGAGPSTDAGHQPLEEGGQGQPHADAPRPRSPPLLLVAREVLNSLVELGRHEAAAALFADLRAQGERPDFAMYGAMVRSHLSRALGRGRQPSGDALTAILDARMQALDLTADVQTVLEEDSALGAALQAAEAAEAAAAGSEAAAPAAAAEALPDSPAGLGSEDEDEEPGAAALAALERQQGTQTAAVADDSSSSSSSDGSSSDSSSSDSGSDSDSDAEAAAAAAAAAGSAPSGRSMRRQQQQQQQQQQGLAVRGLSYDGLPAARLRRMAEDRAANQARSRLRFQVFSEHLDEAAWEEALHVYQEALDAGVQWGPDITHALIRAALDMQAAGVEHAIEVAHAVFDDFERQGLHLGAERGSELLALAARRATADLAFAHRVYDALVAAKRAPKTVPVFKYMRAVALREPGNTARLRELCAHVLADPDPSPRGREMRAEAGARQRALQNGGGASSTGGGVAGA